MIWSSSSLIGRPNTKVVKEARVSKKSIHNLNAELLNGKDGTSLLDRTKCNLNIDKYEIETNSTLTITDSN